LILVNVQARKILDSRDKKWIKRRRTMSNTPHELSTDFPELADKISTLKVSDAHFARRMEEYHALNGQVHRAETDIEPMDDLAQAELRKNRMALKDELYKILTAAS
jgi:uncharacterized protein YdcH (DUF465 family)